MLAVTDAGMLRHRLCHSILIALLGAAVSCGGGLPSGGSGRGGALGDGGSPIVGGGASGGSTGGTGLGSGGGASGGTGGTTLGSGGGGTAGSGNTVGSRGGTTGGTSFGGRGGSFPGVDPCIVTPTPTNCGGGLCGNGVRDTCLIRSAFDACPEVRFTEVCDGSEFGAKTCADFGHGGGTLGCSNFCQTVDTDGCHECKPVDTWLRRCGEPPLTVSAYSAAIAATDTEVALAWLEIDSTSYKPTLGFARLTPSLDLISESRVADASLIYGSDLQVAPLPSGWVVAGSAGPDVFLHAFDAAGRPVGRTTVDVAPNYGVVLAPVLASRPSGGPLVTWGTIAAVRAAIVAADGRSASAPIDLEPYGSSTSQLTAAYVGNAFYVAHTMEKVVYTSTLQVFRVEVDGRVSAMFEALTNEKVYNPAFVAGAGDLRVVYATEVPTVMVWQRFGASGAAATAYTELSTEYSEFGRGVAFGSDTAVLLSSNFYAHQWLGIVRVANDGRITMPLRKIALGDHLAGAGMQSIVRSGPDAIVLWMSYYEGLRLARVTL